MGATSVTGTGLGISGGKQKPKNHITCGCGPSCDDEEEKKVTPTNKGCIVKLKVSNNARHSTCSGVLRNVVCG